ncbi:unnamed protein product [Dovyalis caffra]|uniref:Glutamate decarboxylase n=1 Tax=Dovyalis caffra TaxID=77055 RepID=A0AAV1R5Z1_9ROSI|nr:unnamed protein product [Dovyalis caffra]
MVEENTFCVAAISGSALAGEFEDSKLLNKLLTEKNKETGWDTPIRIDAACGRMSGVPLVAFSLKYSSKHSAFKIAESLRRFGWITPAYTMAADAQKIAVLCVVVGEDFNWNLAESLVSHVEQVLKEMDSLPGRVAVQAVHIGYCHRNTREHRTEEGLLKEYKGSTGGNQPVLEAACQWQENWSLLIEYEDNMIQGLKLKPWNKHPTKLRDSVSA